MTMAKESTYFQMKEITGTHDAKELKREMETFRGVISVSVNAGKNMLAVDYDNSGVACGTLEKRLEQLGYQVESFKTETHIM